MNFATPLCEIAHRYGTDKCPQLRHSYTLFYYDLLKNRQHSIKKVLELGIGTPERMVEVSNYVTGASLYMWREFFPEAQIYGADILPEAMLEADRIKTFICDETNPEDLSRLIEQTGSDIDLVIDDACHQRRIQINACLWLMPMLGRNVTYIIEDINHPDKIMRELSQLYDCELIPGNPNQRSDKMIVVRHK